MVMHVKTAAAYKSVYYCNSVELVAEGEQGRLEWSTEDVATHRRDDKGP